MGTTVLRRSVAALALRIFLLLFLIDTVYALLFILFVILAPPVEYYFGFFVLLWVSHTIKSMIVTALLLGILLQWLSRTYVVDDKHLTVHSGVYALSEKVYELNQLKHVKIHQDWLGRLFHFGTLTLEISSSGFYETLELDDIADPREFKRELVEKYIEDTART